VHPVISAYLEWQRVYLLQPKTRFTEEWYDWTQRLIPAWELFDELTDGAFRYEVASRLASPLYRYGE
jgi:hypothetical protein